MTRIEWTRKAHKQLASIPHKDLERIFEAVEKLVGFPDVPNVKSLVNRPEYRLRVGRYRVIFTVSEDGAVTVILIEEVKKRDEAAELFDKGGNAGSAEKERTEKKVLAVYLPEQMSEEELSAVVAATISELKPDSPKDMGRVIGAVKAEVGNAADGALLAHIVKNALTNK